MRRSACRRQLPRRHAALPVRQGDERAEKLKPPSPRQIQLLAVVKSRLFLAEGTGVAIGKALEESLGVSIPNGTLYSLLTGMERDECWLDSEIIRIEGRRRRAYRINDDGLQALEAGRAYHENLARIALTGRKTKARGTNDRT